jgi:hypothetical protein
MYSVQGVETSYCTGLSVCKDDVVGEEAVVFTMPGASPRFNGRGQKRPLAPRQNPSRATFCE